MSVSLGSKLMAGAVAMAIGGAALANTTLNTTTGDLFLNIVNTTNNTSYLFDTGISQATFNSTGSYSFNLSVLDPTNFANFGASSSFDYSVISATTGNARASIPATMDFTGAVAPNITGTVLQAASATSNFLTAANNTTSGAANSVILPTSAFWGAGLSEGVVSQQLFNNPNTPYSDSAAVGTSLSFYTASGTSPYTTDAYTWTLSTAGILTYGPTTSPVPLPTSVLLLLSGLGLMGVVARRGKPAVG